MIVSVSYNLFFICHMEPSLHNHSLWCAKAHEGFIGFVIESRKNNGSAGECNKYIDDFKSRSAELSLKYGKPVKEEKILAPTAIDDEELYGDHVVKGKLELRNTWETSTTTIILNLKKGSTSGVVAFSAIYLKK